jgi:hypothetical protein
MTPPHMALYADEKPPLDGYDGYVFRVLQNPSQLVWQEFNDGGLARPAANASKDDLVRAEVARQQMGRALSAFYGPSKVSGMNFATPEAALATMDDPDLPDELAYWLLTLPMAIVQRRRGLIEKNLYPSSDQKT